MLGMKSKPGKSDDPTYGMNYIGSHRIHDPLHLILGVPSRESCQYTVAYIQNAKLPGFDLAHTQRMTEVVSF